MSKSLCFIFGMVAGAVAGYYVARQRCEEEIKSVREAFRADSEEPEKTVDKEPAVSPEKQEEIDYMNIIRNNGYSVAPDPTADDDMPYEITPNEFGDIDYEQIELVLFADGVLADGDSYEKVEDVDGMIGKENLTKFGHYEPDRVCVRNDRLKCDYEIICDERVYPVAYEMMYPSRVPYDDEDAED